MDDNGREGVAQGWRREGDTILKVGNTPLLTNKTTYIEASLLKRKTYLLNKIIHNIGHFINVEKSTFRPHHVLIMKKNNYKNYNLIIPIYPGNHN